MNHTIRLRMLDCGWTELCIDGQLVGAFDSPLRAMEAATEIVAGEGDWPTIDEATQELDSSDIAWEDEP